MSNEGERAEPEVILERRKNRLAEVNLPRKPQRNAAAAIEGNYSASHAWFKEHKDPQEWKRYFQDIRTWLVERFEQKNILHWVVHYDEKTPHMHVLFIPLTHNQQRKATKVEREKNPDLKTQYIQSEELRYSSSNFLGGKPGLERLQDELYERAGKARGLERGERGSKARHTDQHTWAAEIAKERQALIADRRTLAQQIADIKKREAALAQQESELAYQQERLTAARRSFEAQANDVRIRRDALIVRERETIHKIRELEKREQQAAYTAQFNERAWAINTGKDPNITEKTHLSLLLTALGPERFAEFYKLAHPIIVELKTKYEIWMPEVILPERQKEPAPSPKKGGREM